MNLLCQCNLLMQLPDRSGKSKREPLQLDREDHQKEQPQPEHRHRDAQQRKALNRLVETAPAVHSREHAQHKADHA